MSSNDVKIEKQARRHRGPLVGIAVAALFAVAAMIWMLSSVLDGEREDPVAPATATETTQ